MSSPTDPDNGLPVRMPRPRRPGRHRKPEPVVAPENAPALVLAVPGTPSGAIRSIAEEILSIARSELPGMDARIGYVEGDGEEFQKLEGVLSQAAVEQQEAAVRAAELAAVEAAEEGAETSEEATAAAAAEAQPRPRNASSPW